MALNPHQASELSPSKRLEFGTAFQSSTMLVAIFDCQARFFTANEVWYRTLHRPLNEQWEGTIYDFFDSKYAPTLESSLHKVAKGQVEHLSLNFTAGFCDYSPLDFILSPLYQDGCFYGYHLSVPLPADVGKSEVAFNSNYVQQTFEQVDEAILITNAGGYIIYTNPVADRMFGMGTGAHIGKPVDEVLQRSKDNGWYGHNHRDDAMATTLGLQYGRRDGTVKEVRAIRVPVYDNQDQERGYIFIVHNGHKSLEIAESLSYQASHDTLTGLANRKELERNLTHALEAAKHFDKCHILCYLDLDLFKVVNDNYSYRAGDALLCQVAREIERELRRSDVVARIGGDEFAILLVDCDENYGVEIIENIRQRIRNLNFNWESVSIDCTSSAGLLVLDSCTPSVSAALSAVDTACSIAKEKGRNRIQHYHHDDKRLKRKSGDIKWVEKIRHALEEQRFRLYYQSITPIQDKTKSERAEILVRMVDGSGQIIPPINFIPAAERYNLMHQIDRWVLEQTLNFCEVFKSSSAIDHINTFSVNISGGSLADEKFMDYIFHRIKSSAVSGENICFEITETYAINNINDALKFIHKLKELGCRFALDDFGSGYSSFSYLKNLPVDYLKIDGCFIRDLVTNPVDYAMVESIHKVGQVMNIQTVAEFVENELILKAITDIGVDYAQGYCVSKPKPLFEEDWGQ